GPSMAAEPMSTADVPPPEPQPRTPSEPRFRGMRFVGTFDRFVLCADRGELVIVDGRAARERLVRARLTRERDVGAVPSRRLLTPLAVDLPPADAAWLTDAVAPLEALGLRVERFGPASFAIRAAPDALEEVDLAALLRDLAAERVGGSDALVA